MSFGSSGVSGDDTRYDELFRGLLEGVQLICMRKSSTLSFEKLYRGAYMLTIAKRGEELHQGVQNILDKHAQGIKDQLAKRPSDELLQELDAEWASYDKAVEMIAAVLMYTDRHLTSKSRRSSLRDVGLGLFCQLVVCHRLFGKRLVDVALDSVDCDRQGGSSDPVAIKNFVLLLQKLSVPPGGTQLYAAQFERPFVARTRRFYERECQLLFATVPVEEYLRRAERRLAEEKRRIEIYSLPESSLPPLKQTLSDCWIGCRYKQLISAVGDFVSTFRESQTPDLRRIHYLFRLVPEARTALRNHFCSCIIQAGTKVLEDAEQRKNPISFIESLFALEKLADGLASDAFSGEQLFRDAVKSGFESFVNTDCLTASHLALYCHHFRKRPVSELTAETIINTTQGIMAMFKNINDKDFFEVQYRSHLSKRLVQPLSRVSIETEKTLVASLKAECGHAYTAKMETMFKDLVSSDELSQTFNQQRHRHFLGYTATSIPNPSGDRSSYAPVEVHVKTLTKSPWNIEPLEDYNIPAEISVIRQEFEEFYVAQHQGRRLTWNLEMGSVLLRAHFLGRVYEFTCTLFQATILLIFNSCNTLKYSEIEEITRIPPLKLKRQLLSLHGKADCRVLLLGGSTPQSQLAKLCIMQDEAISLNKRFTSALQRITLPLIAVRQRGSHSAGQAGNSKLNGDTGEGAPSTRNELVYGQKTGEDGSGDEAGHTTVPVAVEELRKHQVEAAIVRVMKNRRMCDHTTLISEVTKLMQHRFYPSVPMVKMRIERLIAREFLERSEGNRNEYVYTA